MSETNTKNPTLFLGSWAPQHLQNIEWEIVEIDGPHLKLRNEIEQENGTFVQEVEWNIGNNHLGDETAKLLE